MIVGTTLSGKQVIAALIFNHSTIEIPLADAFESGDHFDAFCLFQYLKDREFVDRGVNEFHDMYGRMATFHRSEFERQQLVRPDAQYNRVMTMTEIRRHGACLATKSNLVDQRTP